MDHYAPKDKVEQYAIQMGYTVFPPIIIASDDYLVDGNTRVAARLRRKDIHTTAIVIDVPYKAAKPTVRDDYMALAASLNMTNGQSLTSKELRLAALPLVRAEWKPGDIARRLGITSTRITNVRHEIDAIDRMKTVGVDHEGMDISKVAALGKKNALILNNAPYVELATLAQDAGLNVSEIDNLTKDAKAAGSDEGALKLLAESRIENGDRIREVERTGGATPPKSRRLRQYLGLIVNHEGHVQELIETDPRVGDRHIEVITKSIAVLNELLRMQR